MTFHNIIIRKHAARKNLMLAKGWTTCDFVSRFYLQLLFVDSVDIAANLHSTVP